MHVGEFLPPHRVVGFVFLNEMTGTILPDGATSAKMGVIVKSMDGEEKLVPEGEFLWFESNGWYMFWDNDRRGMNYFGLEFR